MTQALTTPHPLLAIQMFVFLDQESTSCRLSSKWQAVGQTNGVRKQTLVDDCSPPVLMSSHVLTLRLCPGLFLCLEECHDGLNPSGDVADLRQVCLCRWVSQLFWNHQ